MKSCTITLQLLFLSLFISFTSLYSQVTYGTKAKSPILTIEVLGLVDVPIMDAGGEMGDFFTYKGYGTSIGWGGQFNFKFGVGDKGQYRPYISLGYAQLQASDDKIAYIDSNIISKGYPPKGTSTYRSTAGESSLILRIPYVGVGFEFAFVETNRKRTVIPFINLGLNVNIITGMYRQTPDVAKIPSYSKMQVPFTIKTDVRVGLSAGAGADFKLTKNFGLALGTKFHYANMIAKSSGYLHEENKMNILDEGDTDLNSNLKSNRNIGFMEFYLGVSFFIGKSKK